MKIGMHSILCVLAAWPQMHPYLKGNLPETWELLSLSYISSYMHVCPGYREK